jgi:hypothetical protein
VEIWRRQIENLNRPIKRLAGVWRPEAGAAQKFHTCFYEGHGVETGHGFAGYRAGGAAVKGSDAHRDGECARMARGLLKALTRSRSRRWRRSA